MTTAQLDREYTREGITFTVADPIEPIIDDLFDYYGQSLDRTSIVKIALIDHWKNATKLVSRNATAEEAKAIDIANLDETLDIETTRLELAKLGLKV